MSLSDWEKEYRELVKTIATSIRFISNGRPHNTTRYVLSPRINNNYTAIHIYTK